MTYDVVVIGLGAMGSSVVAHAAERGLRTLGLERFARGHEWGASSGRSRLIRKAYFEDPSYVPLLLRTYELWDRLERATGVTVFARTGLLTIGAPESEGIAGTLDSARRFGLAVEQLQPADVQRRYPQTRPRADEVGLFEADAGTLFPEAGNAAHLDVAERAGATLHFEVTVARVESGASVLRVVLADGTSVETSRLVLTAGPWLPSLPATSDLELTIQRNVQLWFQPLRESFGPEAFPAFYVERSDLPAPIYGFPDFGDGVKCAMHAYGDRTAPDNLDRSIRTEDVSLVRSALAGWLPDVAAGTCTLGKACLYALTPDRHFVVDRLPSDPRVVVAGGFSGHGYKFAPVIGEIVADLVMHGGTSHPIEFLRYDRFRRAS